jgi:hypothetical protein
VLCHFDGDRLIYAAIDIGELDRKTEDRRSERDGSTRREDWTVKQASEVSFWSRREEEDSTAAARELAN